MLLLHAIEVCHFRTSFQADLVPLKDDRAALADVNDDFRHAGPRQAGELNDAEGTTRGRVAPAVGLILEQGRLGGLLQDVETIINLLYTLWTPAWQPGEQAANRTSRG